MHDLLIGLAFVGMITCPAIVASIEQAQAEREDELDAPPDDAGLPAAPTTGRA